MRKQFLAVATSALALFAASGSAITVDGIIDAGYGAPLATDPIIPAAGEGGAGPNAVMDLQDLYVANDATNLYVGVTINADISATDWGKYAVFIKSPGITGSTAADAWGRAVAGDSNYQFHSWVDAGGGAGFDIWNGVALVGAPAGNVFAFDGGQVPSAVEISIPLANLGVSGGDTIELNAWVTAGGATDNAQDGIPSTIANATDWGSVTNVTPMASYYVRRTFTGQGTYTVGPGASDFPNLSSFVQAVTGYLHGEGNATVAAASTSFVAGTLPTSFLSEVSAGDLILIGTQVLTVASVDSNTAITLAAPAAAGATNATYVIKKQPAPVAPTGDIVALITGDFNEPKNIPIMGEFETTGTLRIKPAPATQPTITFTRAEDNSGLTGHIVIGGGIQSANILCNTADRVIIDGSNTIAGTTRDLTLLTNATFSFSAPIVINGDNDAVEIRHTRIINNSASTGGSTSGVRAQTGNVTVNLSASDPNLAGLGFADPDNWIVDNCEVSVIGNPTGGQGHGIRNSVSGSPTGAAAQNNFQITNNDITVVIRGLFFDAGIDGALIENNRIVTLGRGGFDTYGIFMNNGRAPGGTTTTRIRNNMIVVRNSSSLTNVTGAWGIRLLSAGAIGNSFEIENNTIDAENTGTFNAGIAPALCGIQMTSGVTGVIRHNSIALRGAGMTPTAPGATIAGFSGPTGVNGNFTIVNNTISSSVQNLVLIRNARDVSVQPFVSNFNNLYVGGTALTGLYLTTTYATLANWQSAPPLFDANSVAVDPAPFTGGDSLHLISDPGVVFQTSNVIGGSLVNDIDGEARGLFGVYYGADEYSANTAPSAVLGNAVASIDENATGVIISNVIGVDADSLDFPVITALASAGTVAVARISPQAYNISLSSPGVDFEAPATSIAVTVTATDRAGATTNQVFNITINDVNEAPTAISPTTGSIDENAASGTTVVTLSTTDQDAGDSHIYTIVAGTGDTNNALFAISGNDLVTSGVLNYEVTPGPLSVRVRSTDSGSLFFEEVITITVNDLNEAATDITLTPSDVDENVPSGTVVGVLAAVDEDAGQTHTFALVAGAGDTDNALFTINGSNLETAASLLSLTSASIRVEATDNGVPPQSFSRQLTVTINPISSVTDWSILND